MQQKYRFEHIDSFDGLHQNSIHALFESDSSMLWVGTQDGLHRYDGTDFTLFLPNRNNPHSISDAYISDMLQQGNTLWVGTVSGGVNALDLTSGEFTQLLTNSGEPKMHVNQLAFFNQQLWVASDHGLYRQSTQMHLERVTINNTAKPKVNSLLVIDENTLLISTANQGAFVYHDGLFTPFILPNNRPSFERARLASDNAIWLAVDGQLWRYASLTATPELIYSLSKRPNAISDFIFDHRHGVWLGGIGTGLIHLQPQQTTGHTLWQVEIIRHAPHETNGLSNDDVFRLLLDRQGNLWVGSLYSGLNRINIDRQYFAHIYNESNPHNQRRNNNIRAIVRAADNQLYVGTNDAGLFKLNDAGSFQSLNALFETQLDAVAAKNIRVLALAPDQQQGLWLATNQGLFELKLPNQLQRIATPDVPKMIRALTFDASSHNVWFAAKNQLYHLDTQSLAIRKIPLTYANSTLESAILNLKVTHSGLWVMSMNGLYLVNASGEIKTYLGPQQLTHPMVRDVLEMRDGTVWIATHGGLTRLKNGKINNISLANNLPSNTVYALASDSHGNLWFTSNKGISRLSATDHEIMTFNENEGLQALEFNGGVSWQDQDGSIWFGGINGLNHFYPNQIPFYRHSTDIALASYRMGNKVYPFYRFKQTTQIVQPYSTDLLSFKVTPIDFSYPNRHQYSFLLQGLDNSWHPFESMNEISYTAVPAGQYQLLVRHKLDGSASFNQQQLAEITIQAPFYRTSWAYAIYTVYALLMIGFISRYYVKKWHKEKQIQQEITDSRERFKLALWGSGDRLWDWHLGNDTFTMTQLSQDDELSQSLEHAQYLALIHPEDRQQVQESLENYLAGHSPYFEAEYRILSADGQWMWGLDRGKVAEVDKDNNPVRMAGTYTNISDRKQQEDAVKLSHQVLESMNEAVVICDLDYRMVSVNRAFIAITGFSEQQVEGKYCLALTRGLYHICDYREIENELLTEQHWAGEMQLRRANGDKIIIWLEINQVLDSKGETNHLVMVFNDISDRKKAEEDLRLLANYDPLTDLPNRTLFQERLKHALEQAKINETKVALLFLDLDRFKTINDSKGHHVGDELLKAVSKRLAGVVRASDTVARIGGDEFTIILEGIVKTKAATVIAEKIINVLDQPFELSQNTLDITTSIGISFSPDDTMDARELLKYADTAMYHAKSMGRNNFQFYSSHMNVSAVRHLQLETGLKQAISKHELRVVYQPKYCIDNGMIVGFEALMRWHSNELGPVSPAEFIPLAEETGLINSIGSWMLDHVAQQLSHWRAQGIQVLPIAVNLSARQLQHELLAEMQQLLQQYDLPASLLEIELTESAVMKHPKQSIAILQRLADLGLSLAVDDFGTGYSSLAYLKRFPINTLKIDREFVRDISEDPDDAAITSAIIALAHSLELQVVAEGVETDDQLQFLASQGCDQIQGFLLSKPVAADACLQMLIDRVASS